MIGNMLLAASLSASSLSGAPAAEGPITSGDVADLCVERTVAARLMCGVFLRGAFDGLVTNELGPAADESSFCLPQGGITLGDIRETFLDFVDSEPERRGEMASTLLFDSLQDRYPCDDDDMVPDAPDVA